jgi:hypothetical protein
MEKPKFSDDFISELKNVIPDRVQEEFKFDIPDTAIGYIRLDEGSLNSIYLICKSGRDSNYDANILIKFKFMDFHYTKPRCYFKFDKVYVCVDGCNEYRYDTNLVLDAVYLKGVSILPNLDKESKRHFWSVLKEWEASDIKTKHKNEYITAYQVVKDGEKTKLPYVVCDDNITKCSAKVLAHVETITSGFDISSCGYFCKAEIKDGETIKQDVKYLMIKNFKETN